MLNKKESNEAIDRVVRKVCVDTVRDSTSTPSEIKTCEKILRKQFGFDDKTISELRK